MLNVLVALPCEARPLIECYRLDMDHKKPFRVYRGKNMRLIVSGVGKIAAATATAYLHVLFFEQPALAWLNIGIAGHKEHPMGKLLTIEKITEHSSGQNWAVPLVIPAFTTGQALTVDRPEENYRLPWIYEMEAAGFFSAVKRLAPDTAAHCLKIISDNSDNLIANITSKTVSGLVKKNLPAIDEVVEKILSKKS